MRWALLTLAAAPSLVPAAAIAADPADRTILVDFIKVQDLAFKAEQSVRCAADAEAAQRTFHQRFDLRLLGAIQWLQKRFSDEELHAADADVHGTPYERVVPACPLSAHIIDQNLADYDKALSALEARMVAPGEGR